MTIKVLESSVINKIAAGEVIERPANVIKELLENSLDAGSDEIRIEIYNSGIDKIIISDNGIGMDREDLVISCKRHSTSKIERETDLETIKSLGFRGEALSSIAEVSQIKIKTKTRENDVGNLLKIEGGIFIEEGKIGCSDGTTIEISNLFYNVPARKKFLKSPEIELAHIIDIVTRYALIKKEISITLKHNDKEIINSQKTTNFLNNVIYIYGTDVTKDLIEVDYFDRGIKITGFISKPSLTKANKNDQSLYINERYIKNNNVINEAIYSGYKTLLFNNRHPICILNVEMDPENFDINIHPSKLEVKFKNEEKIFETVENAIKESLSNQILIPNADIENLNEERKPTIKVYSKSPDIQSNLFSGLKENNQVIVKKTFEISKEETEKINPFNMYRILGQINKSFIICESDLGCAIIDQHAAEERVNYEKFLSELKEGSIKKQRLLNGEIIELNPIQIQTAIEQKNFLEKIGFNFDEFGGNSIRLNSIPEIFGRLKKNIFLDLLGELIKVNKKIIEKEIEDRIIRFACRASIKAGEELSNHEISELLKKLGECNNPYTCPHGRPTITQISIADFEKMFKRTG